MCAGLPTWLRILLTGDLSVEGTAGSGDPRQTLTPQIDYHTSEPEKESKPLNQPV